MPIHDGLVLIRGESIAAACCVNLLTQAALSFHHEPVPRPKLPAVMLSDTTQRLLLDICPQTDLFSAAPRIRRRRVKWGVNAESLALPHSAIVISEQMLLDRMTPANGEPRSIRSFTWTIESSRPLPHASEDIHFGSRIAAASSVTLNATCDSEASWVESIPSGWLFLLPKGSEGWLLSVGGPPEALLAESVLIAPQIAHLDDAAQNFPCHPRIAQPLCGPGWLACGSAALGFDPLCGDGVGNAAREAILASAVVRAAMQNFTADDLLAHYQARLLAGLERHLQSCHEFYRSGHAGPWWEEQIHATQEGLSWCRLQRAQRPAFKFRLTGFSLEPL